jgi:DNA-binding Lrp family transcriptional regulator
MLICLRTSIILHRLMPISKANYEQKNNTKIRSTRTVTTTSTTNKNNLQHNNNNYKHILKQPDIIDIKIISELLKQPDIGNTTISKKLKIPLSTIQRRRTRIENSILKKNYALDFKKLGARVGDLIINVNKGRSKELAQTILQKYKQNIISVDTRINSSHNVFAHIVFKDSTKLHDLIESVKSMENVIDVSWSEVIEVMEGGDLKEVEDNVNYNKFEVLKLFLDDHNNKFNKKSSSELL